MLSDAPFIAVINETNRVLSNALDEGILDNSPPEEMLRKLKEDVFIFSALKTHAQLKEASELLLNQDGTIKMFNAFKQDVLTVHKAYNVNHLEAEYIFATSSAETAAQWQQWQQDGDRYNLQLRTAGDNKVRDSHAVLNLTTLPDDDPFWDLYITPLGWRCRCRTIQVRKNKYPVSDSSQAIKNGELATTRIDKNGNNRDEIFRFNPGKDKMIFPPRHPYRAVQERVMKIVKSLSKQNEWETVETRKGSVQVSPLHGKHEKTANVEIAVYFANRYGYDIRLIAKAHNTVSADSFNSTLNIHQEYKTNKTPTKNAVDKQLKAAKRQADHIVLDIKSKISPDDLTYSLIDRVQRSKSIQSVWVKKENNDWKYSREEILGKGFKIQWD